MGIEESVLSAIGSVGFPIVACCYMAYIHNESEKRHSEEWSKMTNAINDLSKILEVMKDRIGVNGITAKDDE